MRLTQTEDIYEAKSEYGDWRAKKAGFWWDPEKKVWWTKNPKQAYKIRNCATPELAQKIEEIVTNLLKEERQSLELSRATNSNIEIPAPYGLNYLPYQKAGIHYAMNKDGTLFGDEMGLGKTIQAIGVMNMDETIEKTLVICPASLKINWLRELDKWLVHHRTIGIANAKRWSYTNVTIINFDILRKYENLIREIAWDLLIVDECHYLKNPKAQRTKQVLGGYGIDPIKARKRLFLTGTPMVNRPIELYAILKSLNPTVFGSFRKYADRYCGAHYNGHGWNYKGASNLGELQDKLRQTCMVRRLKKDVLTELPAKRRQIIELPVNGCSSIVKKEQKILEEYEKQLAKKRLEIELAKAVGTIEEYREKVRELKQASMVPFTEIAKARHDVAIAKIPAVIDRINDVISTGNKVVVFAHHHDVIDRIKEELGSIAVKLDGRDSMEQRDNAVTRFQEYDQVRVFIGGIKAAGVGITLTASSHVIFVELDWVPGNLSQAEDRCHRIGQKQSVLVQHLVLEGSIDALMAETIVRKQTVLDHALDKETSTADRENRIKQEISLVEKQTVIPLEPTKENNAATHSTTYTQITKEAEKITRAEIDYYHKGVTIIKSVCDGVRKKDGMGFSMIDREIGNSLALSEKLTPRQGVMAKKLCRKYRKQLSEHNHSFPYNK